MTIREYYANYKTTKKCGFALTEGTDKTVAEFYEHCIEKNVLDKDVVLAWHKMFMEYIDREDAVFWIRYYESGSKASGRWNNRRACVTKFKDGFSYVFVSNYDVHEIFNMVRLGVTPSVDEFSEMMNSYEFPLHYDSGKSCEESDIACFPKIGTPHGGILTVNHLYLAHINGIKSKFVRCDGTNTALDESEVNRLFPRGDVGDWKNVGGKMIRTMDSVLSDEDKALVKAHFLRFVDPLNYYVVPARDHETNSLCSAIGEHHNLNLYVAEQYAAKYGQHVLEEFRRVARIAAPNKAADGGEEINITYGPTKCGGGVAPKKASAKTRKARGAVPSIVFEPSDEELFKRELLKHKKATITWKYSDGTEDVKTWDAGNFSATSSIRSNIQSRPQWRAKDSNGLIEVIVKI